MAQTKGDEETLFLEVDLGTDGQLAFETFEELKAWYEGQKSFFSNLLSSRIVTATQARPRLQQRWQNVDNLINRAQQAVHRGEDISSPAEQLRPAVQQLYHGPDSLFLAESPEGKFLQKLRAEDPDDAAAALCLLLGQHLDPQQPSSYRGAVALALYEKGLPHSAESHREAIEEVYRDGKTQVAVLKRHHTRLGRVTDQLEQSNQELLTEADAALKKLQEEHSLALEESLAQAREALTAHEEAYSEKLALHSAVQYWKQQGKRRSKQGAWTASLFALSLVGASTLLSVFSHQLFAGEITPQKIGAILLTVSPIFWGLRVLARLLLSYMHLGTDAAERQILIETYLALHKEGKIDDEDREFLLAAIFRPASTGIVRDDAAPTWSDVFSKLSGK